MPIDSVGSYEDFYSDDLAETSKAIDKPPAWNGRTVLTTKENRRMHSMLESAIAYRKRADKSAFFSGSNRPTFIATCNFNSNPNLNPFLKLPTAYNPPPQPTYTPPPTSRPVFVQPPPPLPRPVFVQPPPPPSRPVFVQPPPLPRPLPPSFDPSNKYDPPKLLNSTANSSSLNLAPPVPFINPIQATPPTNTSPPHISLFPSEVARSGGISTNVYPSIAPNPEIQKETIGNISNESDKTVAESAREISSGPIHEAWKDIGILGKNTLLLIEDLNPSISIGPKKGITLREAWETEAVPSVHEKIDQLFSTNIKDDFDPKKDGIADQVLQNFFLNPLTGLGGVASTESVVSQGANIGIAENVFGNAGKVFANEALVAEKAAAMASRQTVVAEEVGILENVNNIAKIGNFKYTNTVLNHLNDVVKKGPYKGELSRPYMRSPQIIDEIIAAGKPIQDPGGVPGALRWDVPGTFRGAEGTWELVLHPENGIIYHFNFK